jgi:hypothetical protein
MRRLIAAAFALCLALAPLAAAAQSRPMKFDSAASTNATEVIIGKAQIRMIALINTTTTIYYLKFYDVAAAPTCGTTTPVVWKVPVPFGTSNAGGGAIIPIPDGLDFSNGIGFCLTGSNADNDSSNAATGVTINLGVKQ